MRFACENLAVTGISVTLPYFFPAEKFIPVKTALKITGNSQKSAPIYYDLTGRRVERPTRGIYIRNGKKISIK